MAGIELRQRVVNLLAFPIGPRVFRKLGRRLNRDPTSECAGGQHQSAASARPTHDPAPGGIEGGRTAWLRRLGALDTAIERRRETKQRENANLEAQERLFGRRTLVESRQEPHRGIEHGGLGLVLRDTLTDHSHRCTSHPDRLQAPEDLVERLVDRYTLQVRELAPARSEVRLHQDVGLQRPAKPALALSGATSERRDLAVLLC